MNCEQNVINTKNSVINVYKFEPIDSRMYLMVKNDKALIIDPCISKEALKLLKQQCVDEVTVILTHEHYDHISGVNWLRKNFNCKVICSEKCGLNIKSSNKNLSAHFSVLFLKRDFETKRKIEEVKDVSYTCEADITFNSKLVFEWEKCDLELIETPGHSQGSICVFFNRNIIFTGDTLVNGHEIITRLPGGSKKDYESITLPLLKSIDYEMMIYPGHGDAAKMKEFLI